MLTFAETINNRRFSCIRSLTALLLWKHQWSFLNVSSNVHLLFMLLTTMYESFSRKCLVCCYNSSLENTSSRVLLPSLQYPIIAGRIRVVSHGRVAWNGQNLFKASCIIQDNSTAVPIDLLGSYGATVYGKSKATPPHHFFILAGVYCSKEEWKFAMRKA